MKTRNLTQSSLRNDPINRRVHGFSFGVFEDKIWSSRWDFSFPSRSKSDFKHSLDAETGQEHEESNWHLNWCLDSSNFSKIQRRVLPSRRTVFKEKFLGVTVDLTDVSWLTVAITRPLIESSLLINDRLIASEGLRCILIAWRRKRLDSTICWMLSQRSPCVKEFTDHVRSQPL